MFARLSGCWLASLALFFVSSGDTVWSAEEAADTAVHGAEADGHGGGHGDPNPLSVDPDLALWTGVVFLVLFAVLSKFAWPAISAALLERERKIEKNIADAALKHEEAKQMLVSYEARLASAADEVRALLEEARRDAEYTKNQIISEAKKAADAERERSLLEVDRARDAALKSIAESSANMAVELAGNIVTQNLTADQQAQLVRDALGRLTTLKPSQN